MHLVLLGFGSWVLLLAHVGLHLVRAYLGAMGGAILLVCVSWVLDLGRWILGLGSCILGFIPFGLESCFLVLGFWVLYPSYRILDLGSWILYFWVWDLGSCSWLVSACALFVTILVRWAVPFCWYVHLGSRILGVGSGVLGLASWVAPAAGLDVKQDAAAGRLGVKRDADAPALASVSQAIASAASSDAVSQKNEAGPNHGKTLKRRRLKEVE